MGIYPPMVTDDGNASGNPKGFWSIHVYATDPTEGAAPFIAQTSVLNTHFSTADTAVLSVNADGSGGTTITVNAPNWGKLVASTPILFGGDTSAYGWFGPALPAGAPASNWIPTPSAAYYGTLYPETVSTQFQLTLRMYYPTPGDSPPSVLKCTVCTPPLAESYIPPVVELVQ
jgi:hypothetical protein